MLKISYSVQVKRQVSLNIIIFFFKETRNTNKVTLSSKVTSCSKEDFRSDYPKEIFFHPPRRFYSVDKRSMSLDTQLPDSEVTSLKESASKDVSKRPSNKRTWSRNISCDEKLLAKVPKVRKS